MQEDEDNDLMKHQGVETSILLHLFRRGGAGELERLQERIQDEKGITFEEFKDLIAV